ncbi:ARM repeat-containing protein [Wallemia mellicola]|nr:ARM repeat-containing protein [Wallemia mellicola]
MEEDELLSTFNHLQEYSKYLDIVLDESITDTRTKDSAVYQIGLVLEIYQEQSYLLDPYLDQMLSPVISALSTSISRNEQLSTRNTLSKLIYTFSKTRGHKIITRFFPHSIPDLILVLDASRSFTEGVAWEYRYILLLWLSIAIKIPFDLSKLFPNQDIATQLQNICTAYFHHPGKEREAAVLVLSRSFMRQDMKSRLIGFVQWCLAQLETAKENAFIAPSVLQFFSEVLKVSQGATVAELQGPIEHSLAHSADISLNNPLLRKYCVKLTARLAYKLSDDIDKVEETIGYLLEYLSDTDTIVRWSAAKHLSRIAAKLGDEHRTEILDAVLSIYAENTKVDDASSNEFANCDYSYVSESAWHGATLSLAEAFRNGVVPSDYVSKLVPAAIASIHFDLKKGTASVGSNTRDAAAYLFWAMSRSVSPAIMEDFIDKISIHLIQKALFDREVHIRRAASAAYQEMVGRTNLIKHGIDVLRAVDFFVVGVRRTAFLDAAVDVCEYEFYRNSIIPFVVKSVITHWDFDVRKLASQFLGRVCKNHPYLLDRVVEELKPRLASGDPVILHGTLSTLHQLSIAFMNNNQLYEKIFEQLEHIQLWQFHTPRFSPVLEVSNNLIAAIASTCNLESRKEIALKIIDIGLKHKSDVVRYSSANALGCLSKTTDCKSFVQSMIDDFQSSEGFFQQSIALSLGYLYYNEVTLLNVSLNCLLSIVSSKTVVECRLNAYESLSKLYTSCTSQQHTILQTLYNGLWDYSMDQRGDVGAWIRQSCAKGLTICLSENVEPSFVDKVVSRLVGISLDNIYTSRWVAIEELENMIDKKLINDTQTTNSLRDFFYNTRKDTEDVYSSSKIFEHVVTLYQQESKLRDDILMGLGLALISKNEISVYNSRMAILGLADNLLDDVVKRSIMLSESNTKTSFFTGLANTLFVVLDERDVCCDDLSEIVAFNSKYCQKSKVINRITIGMKIVATLFYKYDYQAAKKSLIQYLTHSLPRIRAITAEEVYIQSQVYDGDQGLLDWLMDIDWLGKNLPAAEVKL